MEKIQVCPDNEESCCPFAFTEASEMVQNYGCLPDPVHILDMRVAHGKTWACHMNTEKPCVGAIRELKRRGLPHKVIDDKLVTEQTEWPEYSGETYGT